MELNDEAFFVARTRSVRSWLTLNVSPMARARTQHLYNLPGKPCLQMNGRGQGRFGKPDVVQDLKR